MNRKFSNYFEGVVVINVKGKKADRFLSYLYKFKINLLKVDCLDRQNIFIKIYHRDLEKVMNIKTTSEISIVGYEGKLKIREGVKKHFPLLLSILIGYIVLIILSNIIFDVEVIHSNANVRDLITNELAKHDIERWHFKKNYEGIEKIKKEILDEYKDRLEWIEIENIGTKYIVKVEERKIKPKTSDYIYQDIVSNKSAIIMRIDATEGEIVKRQNDYVKKGDVIISGRIMKGNEVSKLIKADGKIYGEVWYNIKIEHPLIYQNRIETGKKKDVYKISFLNHSISLFNIHPFSSTIASSLVIINNPLIPFTIVKESQKEVIVQDEIYTDGEALIMAEQQAIKKMEDYLDEDEHIISYRKLKYYVDNQKLYLEMFFKVYENIGVPRAITE